jgi:hypothetical protein
VVASTSGSSGGATSASQPAAADPQKTSVSQGSGDWLRRFNDQLVRDPCNFAALRAILSGEIGQRAQALRSLQSQVARLGLSSANAAIVAADLAALLADVQGLQSRVDGEATVAGFKADRDAVAAQSRMLATASSWLCAIRGAQGALNQVGPLTSLQNRIEGWIATARPSWLKNRAQAFLGLMKADLSAGTSIAGSALNSLLGVSVSSLASGKARTIVATAQRNTWVALWRFFQAWVVGLWAARMLGH